MTSEERARVEAVAALQARHEVHLEASGHYSDFGYQLAHDPEWRRLRLDLADSVPFLLGIIRRLTSDAAPGDGGASGD